MKWPNTTSKHAFITLGLRFFWQPQLIPAALTVKCGCIGDVGASKPSLSWRLDNTAVQCSLYNVAPGHKYEDTSRKSVPLGSTELRQLHPGVLAATSALAAAAGARGAAAPAAPSIDGWGSSRAASG